MWQQPLMGTPAPALPQLSLQPSDWLWRIPHPCTLPASGLAERNGLMSAM